MTVVAPSRTEVEDMCAHPEPAVRVVLATELLRRYAEATDVVAGERRAALTALHERGMTLRAISARVGMSFQRVWEILERPAYGSAAESDDLHASFTDAGGPA